MIRKITSDLATFKTLKFKSGLNILLADKSEGATDKQSRNGAGKSSFVEVVHFLLGSDADKESIFRTETLREHAFFMEFDLSGNVTMVGRNGIRSSEVQILHGQTESWPHHPKLIKGAQQPVLANTRWREVLGRMMFGIDVDEEDVSRFEPRFRQLFAYFVRRQSAGAFQMPTSQGSKQQPWDIQLALSYLIGLDWTLAKRFQEVRTKEKIVKELRSAIREGGISGLLSPAAELKTRVTVTEARVRRLQQELGEFRVVPEYSELEQEANTLTMRMGTLSDENTTDKALVSTLEDSLRQEEPPGITMLEQMYEEAGITLPKKVTRRFEDVVKFHQTIIDNRRAHLRSEVEQANSRVAARTAEMTKLDARRAQVMRILQTGGALENYSRLQEELARAEAEAETLRRSLALAEEIETKRTAASIERKQLYQRLQEDHHEQGETIRKAILTFEEISTALYEKAGSLLIDASENGPHFDVAIEGARSRGITNMQIFCFDLMLTILNQERGRGPGFLIHDSHLFDGVDERQVAKAIQLGSEKADRYGFQYIITMNSDALPRDGFKAGFDVAAFVIEPRLTDKTDTGGLFGFRFN